MSTLESVMQPEFWEFAVPAAAAAIAAIAGSYFTSRSTNRKVNRVISLSEPTGNGFAEKVVSALAEIKAEQRAMREEQAEIKAEQKAMREEQRSLRTEMRALGERVAALEATLHTLLEMRRAS